MHDGPRLKTVRTPMTHPDYELTSLLKPGARGIYTVRLLEQHGGLLKTTTFLVPGIFYAPGSANRPRPSRSPDQFPQGKHICIVQEARSLGSLVNAFLTQPAHSMKTIDNLVLNLVCGACLKGVGGFSLVCDNDGSRVLTEVLIWTT